MKSKTACFYQSISRERQDQVTEDADVFLSIWSILQDYDLNVSLLP